MLWLGLSRIRAWGREEPSCLSPSPPSSTRQPQPKRRAGHSHSLCTSSLPTPSRLQPARLLHHSPLLSLPGISLGDPLSPSTPTTPSQCDGAFSGVSISSSDPQVGLGLPASLPDRLPFQSPKTPVHGGKIQLLSVGDLRSILFGEFDRTAFSRLPCSRPTQGHGLESFPVVN